MLCSESYLSNINTLHFLIIYLFIYFASSIVLHSLLKHIQLLVPPSASSAGGQTAEGRNLELLFSSIKDHTIRAMPACTSRQFFFFLLLSINFLLQGKGSRGLDGCLQSHGLSKYKCTHTITSNAREFPSRTKLFKNCNAFH